MLQTLFHIPGQIGGIPLFDDVLQAGPQGILFWAWVAVSLLILVRLACKQGINGDTLGYVPLFVLVGAVIWFFLPRLCDQHGLPIRGYGMMLLLAVVASVGLAAWRARRVGIDPELIFNLAFWVFVPGILGARTFYVIEYWSQFQKETTGETLWAIVNVAQGGLVVYGSVLGGFFGLAAFVWIHKLPGLATLDLVTPSLMLGISIGRIGCLLNGCCFGNICEEREGWSLRFPNGSPAHQQHVEEGETFLHGLKVVGPRGGVPSIADVEAGSEARKQGVPIGKRIVRINGRRVLDVKEAHAALMRAYEVGARISVEVDLGESRKKISGTTDTRFAVYRWSLAGPPASEPVQPAQILSAISTLLICLFLLAYAPFRRRDGEIWALFLTLYPVVRFLLEMIRSDESGAFGTAFSISQLISLALFGCALTMWVYVLSRPPGTVFPKYSD